MGADEESRNAAAKALAALGGGSAAALATGAGPAAIPAVALGVLVVALVEVLAVRRGRPAEAQDILARIQAGSASRSVEDLRSAIVAAAGLEPAYKDELERLVDALEDPQRVKENELLRTALQRLFLRAGKPTEAAALGRIDWPGHHIRPASQRHVENFVGRTGELAQLNQAVAEGTSVVCVVGMAGEGKSCLLGRWYGQAAAGLADRAVFWCRPYDAGYTFAVFLTDVLSYLTCGQFDPRQMPSPVEQAEHFCRLLRDRPAIIVLDGAERWLAAWAADPDASGEGATRDDRAAAEKGLDLLLSDAPGWANGSALVMTTRALPSALDDAPKALVGDPTPAGERKLTGLDDQAAVELLTKLGVRGNDEQVLEAASEYDNHALTLTVLGHLLREHYGGDVGKRPEVDVLGDDTQARLGRLLDRVAEHHAEFLPLLEAIACCLVPAPVELLAHLLEQSEKEVRGVAELGKWQLAAFEGEAAEEHALIGKYLLVRLGPARAGENRLKIARWFGARPLPEQPRTLEEVGPLIRAAEHALAGGDVDLATDFLYSAPAGGHHATLDAWLRAFGYLGTDVSLLTGAIELYDSLPPSALPELRNDLTTALNNRGCALKEQGDLPAAVADFGRVVEIREALVHEEGRRELRNYLAMAYNNRGIALGEQGDLPAALADYGRAVEIFRTLVHDEGRSELRNDLAMAYSNRGIALEEQGNLPAALAYYGRAIEIRETLVHEEGRTELRNDLAMAYNNRGVALWHHGELAGALADYGRAIRLRETLVHDEGRTELVGDLEKALFNRALAYLEDERGEDARADMARGAELLHPAIRRGRWDLLGSFLRVAGPLCGLLIDLGRAGEAAEWVNRAVVLAREALAAEQKMPLLGKQLVGFYADVGAHVDVLADSGLQVKDFRELGKAAEALPRGEGEAP